MRIYDEDVGKRASVDLRPDAIFGVTTPATGALARETEDDSDRVCRLVSDPIGSGFAANLAHPAGNVAGFMSNDPAGTLGGKWVELLKQIAPRTVRVALLFDPATSRAAFQIHPAVPIQAAAFISLAVQVDRRSGSRQG